jgi:MATE family multidrug resistance protein
MGMPADVTRLAIDYFEIRLIGYAFMAWLTALTMFFQAIGRPMIPTVTSFIAVGVNIVLNALLIFGLFGFPRLEVQGAAIATVIALGLQCVLLQGIFLSRAVDSRYATRGAWRFDRVKWGELLRIGVPAGLTFFMDVATWGIFTSFIVGRFGEMQLAAHSVALAVMHLSFMPAVGLNHAIAPIVGKYIGAKDIPRAMARTHTCYKLAISYMTCMGIVAAIGGPVIIRWFLPHASPELVRTGHTLLMMAALFQAFDAINIVASGALRGAGDTRWMAIITFFMAYGCFLPVAGGLAILVGWEAPGAWVGATIYIIALSGFLFTRFESRRWQSIRVFADDDPEAAADPVIDAEPAPSPGPATPAG